MWCVHWKIRLYVDSGIKIFLSKDTFEDFGTTSTNKQCSWYCPTGCKQLHKQHRNRQQQLYGAQPSRVVYCKFLSGLLDQPSTVIRKKAYQLNYHSQNREDDHFTLVSQDIEMIKTELPKFPGQASTEGRYPIALSRMTRCYTSIVRRSYQTHRKIYDFVASDFDTFISIVRVSLVIVLARSS